MSTNFNEEQIDQQTSLNSLRRPLRYVRFYLRLRSQFPRTKQDHQRRKYGQIILIDIGLWIPLKRNMVDKLFFTATQLDCVDLKILSHVRDQKRQGYVPLRLSEKFVFFLSQFSFSLWNSLSKGGLFSTILLSLGFRIVCVRTY